MPEILAMAATKKHSDVACPCRNFAFISVNISIVLISFVFIVASPEGDGGRHLIHPPPYMTAVHGDVKALFKLDKNFDIFKRNNILINVCFSVRASKSWLFIAIPMTPKKFYCHKPLAQVFNTRVIVQVP